MQTLLYLLLVLGPFPSLTLRLLKEPSGFEDKNPNYSSKNIPDFFLLEQSYLDKYKMEYNVSRVASSKYATSSVSVNKGEANPSYNLRGEESLV